MNAITGQIANIVLGVAILAWIIWNQIRTRRVQENTTRLYFILGAIGLIETYTAISQHGGVGAAALVWIVGSLVVAAAFGVVRALTVNIWRDTAGAAWRKGTALTVILWLVAIAIHFGFELAIDHFSVITGLGAATVLLYLAISLGIQREVVRRRVQGTVPGPAR